MGYFSTQLESAVRMFAAMSTADCVYWGAITAATLFFMNTFYNFYLHPLAHIPGPKLAVITDAYYLTIFFSGRAHLIFTELHAKYGPIVRVGPNKLSFNTPQSFRDIYLTHPKIGLFRKSLFYSFDPGLKNLVSTQDPVQHTEWKNLLGSAFSNKSVCEQESMVQQCIDMLIIQLAKKGTGEEGTNVVDWYVNITFDIIGELAFGESFGSLLVGKTHEWVQTIAHGANAGANRGVWVNYLGDWWGGELVADYLQPRKARNSRDAKMAFCEEKMRRRMAANTDRKDYISNFIRDGKWVMPLRQLTAQLFTFAIAGSDTSSTFLSATTYHLLRNPSVLRAVTQEIRSAFSTYDSIVNNAVLTRCPLLRAVIGESLRLHPPVPLGLPRLSPGAMVSGIYVPAGVEVFTSTYAAHHSPDNFKDPEKFIPERWMSGDHEYSGDKREASVPFSLGSRSCLGVMLAMLENRLVLAKMLWVFDMEMVGEDKGWMEKSKSALLWSRPELMVRFTKREGAVVPGIDG